MTSQAIKIIFLLLLYLSYFCIAISIILIIITNDDGKTKLLDYISEESNKILLVVLIALALAIYVLYQMFKTNKELTAKARKGLNMVIDILRGVFHVLYVLYIYPYVL